MAPEGFSAADWCAIQSRIAMFSLSVSPESSVSAGT